MINLNIEIMSRLDEDEVMERQILPDVGMKTIFTLLHTHKWDDIDMDITIRRRDVPSDMDTDEDTITGEDILKDKDIIKDGDIEL